MQTTLTLNNAQFTALTCQCTEKFYIGGLGSGKSFTGGIFLAQHFGTKGALMAIFAPTRDTLKNATLRQLQEAWSKLGLIEDQDYVIGRRPPKSWDVQPYTRLSSSHLITTRWGAYLIADSLENYNKHRGTEFDRIFVDEFRDVRPEARQVLLGRLRGKAFKRLGLKADILYASTPPEDPRQLLQIQQQATTDPELCYIHTSSYANAANLPTGYLERLKSAYDDLTYRREVLGQAIALKGRPFAYSFDPAKHVSDAAVYTPEAILYLSFDFNVDPLTAVAYQHTAAYIHQVDEFRLKHASVYDLAETIRQRYPTAVFAITGDASGANRSVLAKGNTNAYTVLRQVLNVDRARYFVPRVNQHVADSRILLNTLLQNHPSWLIHPSCRHSIEDLQYVLVNDDGTIDKSNAARSHLLDCIRYYAYTFHRDFLRNQSRR